VRRAARGASAGERDAGAHVGSELAGGSCAARPRTGTVAFFRSAAGNDEAGECRGRPRPIERIELDRRRLTSLERSDSSLRGRRPRPRDSGRSTSTTIGAPRRSGGGERPRALPPRRASQRRPPRKGGADLRSGASASTAKRSSAEATSTRVRRSSRSWAEARPWGASFSERAKARGAPRRGGGAGLAPPRHAGGVSSSRAMTWLASTALPSSTRSSTSRPGREAVTDERRARDEP